MSNYNISAAGELKSIVRDGLIGEKDPFEITNRLENLRSSAPNVRLELEADNFEREASSRKDRIIFAIGSLSTRILLGSTEKIYTAIEFNGLNQDGEEQSRIVEPAQNYSISEEKI